MKADKRQVHTFVVCAYQESPYLEECIRSLMGQTVNSQICIATSTPNRYIKNIAKKYGLSVFVNTGEKGLAGDWNFAVSCGTTPYVTLAHQDDLYLQKYAEDVLGALETCSRPLLAFTDYYERRMDKEGNERRIRTNKLLRIKRLMLFPLRFSMFWNSRFVRRCILSMGSAICCPSVTLAKNNLDIPIFENNMKSNIDWQAWEKISNKKGAFAYIAKPSMEHRIHPASTTSEVLKNDERKKEDLYMYRKFWPGWIARGIEFFYQKSEKSNYN